MQIAKEWWEVFWADAILKDEYSNDRDAAFALLQDVTQKLLACGVDFVVVGGWVPVLFHAGRFGHPGTYDVDILVNATSLDDNTFDAATAQLLDSGYLRAVKNTFQAHRIIRVAGEDFVFHVDFLNERNPDNELLLLRSGSSGKIASIYTPAMKAVFKYPDFRFYPGLPQVRFPSVETFIATKAVAVGVSKRLRDAFDVFVSVADQDTSLFKSRWQSLMGDGLFRDANRCLWKAVYEGDALQKIELVLRALPKTVSISMEQIRSTFDFLVG